MHALAISALGQALLIICDSGVEQTYGLSVTLSRSPEVRRKG